MTESRVTRPKAVGVDSTSSRAAEGFRYEKLTDDQLLGAHYALRLVRTSPRIKGSALDMLDGQIDDCEHEMAARRWNAGLESNR